MIMREPCRVCGGLEGSILEKTGQDTVRCVACDAWVYNAPRVETGRKQRSVTTVHAAIKPKQRMRILDRASSRCEVCGSRGNLHVGHVGHIVSVVAGLNYGMTEVELNDDENLMAMCEECNLGQGAEPMSLRLAMVVLRARIAWHAAEKAS